MTNKRNIKFVGRQVWDRQKRKVIKDPQPVESYSSPAGQVILPAAALQVQDRFFYHAKAAEIARLFPWLYKLVKNPRS